MRYKIKPKVGSCPFKISHGIGSTFQLESNPFVRKAASSQECLLEGVKTNTAPKPKKQLEDLEQKALTKKI